MKEDLKQAILDAIKEQCNVKICANTVPILIGTLPKDRNINFENDGIVVKTSQGQEISFCIPDVFDIQPVKSIKIVDK